MEDKRKHKRLELTGEILIKELGGSGNHEAVDIKITDCSRDGIGFSTTEALTIGSNYEANLTLWNKDKINVFIQIVRAVKDGDMYHYGGIFIGMPDDVQMRIQVYETVSDELAHQGK
ncbi:PilZ domain-containing protein [Butyrivibrio sp. YAB3001]|nr:PilZ domain-containing protein [Butyrivibrio sp. YAB3001]